MKAIIFDIENAWLKDDFETAKMLSDSMLNNIESLSDAEKEYVLPKLEDIYANFEDYVAAAHFLVLYYPFLEKEILDGKKTPSLLDTTLRKLLTYLENIEENHSMWPHFDNFLKAKFRELDDYSYPREPDIKSCVNDAIFAFQLGNTQRSLSIIDIGLKSVKSEKSRELLTRLKADIEAGTLI